MVNYEVKNEVKKFVECIIGNLVDCPDKIKTVVNPSTIQISVLVDIAPQDRGKVIGKQGRTIEAIKVIVMAAKNTKFPEDKRKVSIEILEDEQPSFTH
jgi:predicted RNA-binding protein YlqC (UPF0109 family)